MGCKTMQQRTEKVTYPNIIPKHTTEEKKHQHKIAHRKIHAPKQAAGRCRMHPTLFNIHKPT
jgi:hypothetical protein